jgi:hypothetical protein
MVCLQPNVLAHDVASDTLRETNFGMGKRSPHEEKADARAGQPNRRKDCLASAQRAPAQTGRGGAVMFRTLVEERVRARPLLSIDTTPPAEEERVRHAREIEDSVTASIGRQLEAMRREVKQPAALNPERDFGSLGTRSDVIRHVSSRLFKDVSFPLIPLLLPRVIIVSPPYAHEWAAGSGLAFGAIVDGSLVTVDTQGVSVAGVNVYLTSNADHEMDAMVTPLGTFKWSWLSAEDLPTLQTQGGLGTNVTHNGSELSRREVALWARTGATTLSGESGGGDLPKAASMASGPFGPIEIFPTYIQRMRPGEPYLFALWCWQAAQYPDDASWIGMMNATMTGVWVSLSEPTIIA